VTSRSEHWLRVAVNQHTGALDALIEQTFGWDSKDPITWLSPLADDDYAEYFDESFLKRMDLSALEVPLVKFWPKSGPRWDALARTRSGRLLLVEAKAYIEEGVDFRSRAEGGSLRQIRKSLAAAKEGFRASADASWETPFYQYANRLAHLYYLNSLNHQRAHLLFLYFADAPDVPQPCSVAQWEGADRLVRKCLGLPTTHPFSKNVGTLIWSVPAMLKGEHGSRAG